MIFFFFYISELIFFAKTTPHQMFALSLIDKFP